MTQKKIRIPRESAVDIMEELGKLNDAIQFLDLNVNDYEERKNYGSMIKRCEEMEKKINSFESLCQSHNERLVKYASYDDFKRDLDFDKREKNCRSTMTYFDLIENEIMEDEVKLNALLQAYTEASENLENLIEKKSVFDKASQLLLASTSEIPGIAHKGIQGRGNIMMPDPEPGFKSDLNFIAGVIKSEDELRMKRTIFRVSKGRAIPTFFDPFRDKMIKIGKVPKKIFTIFFQGGVENFLLSKLIKACDIFSASRFSIPKRDEIQAQINELQSAITHQKTTFKTTETSIKGFIKDKIGFETSASKYERYKIFSMQEKLIYTNLNKCKQRGNFIDGEVWIPLEKFDDVQSSMGNIRSENESKLIAYFTDVENESSLSPPTYIKTNEFTAPFQMIVNEYGIPRYREINPALFNIITFPFLFGMMFGDIGHGLLLAGISLFLVLKHDDILRQDPSLKSLLKARYLFLFMGCFAFYCGWMYNDFISLPLGIFGTCYRNVEGENNEMLVKRLTPQCVYPFGLDPKWYVAKNELTFMNSLKMKTSVIFGVTQMIFGIILKGINAIYFNSPVDFIFEFIPQLLFMSLMFGYMNIMIFIKWATDWSSNTRMAPSIIAQLLLIFLDTGSVGKEFDKKPLYSRENYQIQESIQYWFLIICLICVPLMLFPKPLIIYFRSRKQKEQHFHQLVAGEDGGLQEEPVKSTSEHGANESIGELFVHQTIETIEYVLGTVSCTASYLRLWALSLAHAQLSKVFFEITLLEHIRNGNILSMMFGFFIFANITVGVLMGMDLMECFLHTLRLHWVEFQNKFYKADGYLFTPFCFKYIFESVN